MATDTTAFAPLATETGQPLGLAMQKLWLTGRVTPAGARLVVRHWFRSSEPKPLEVIYSFGLPRDAALRRFRISGEGFSVRSELRPVADARKAYESGLEKGSLSALATQYRDGVVNLAAGNVRPGETVRVDLELLAGVESHDHGLRFRFPFTLAPSYHARARMAEAAPGEGEIELPEDEFGDVLLPGFRADASDLHEVGFDLSIRASGRVVEVASPSHPLRAGAGSNGEWRVGLATGRDVPDRDLVLDIKTAADAGGLMAERSGGKVQFAAILPSGRFGSRVEAPRKVVFTIDRSGSMSDVPMKQAKAAVRACLGALEETDRFNIIAFDDRVEKLSARLLPGTAESRNRAEAFLDGIDARGGTELAEAVQHAAAALGQDGDIFLATDGQVFGTETILATARNARARVTCLGIGAASQDRFLSLLARETGGQSRFLTPRERVDTAAVDLFASLSGPAASNLECRFENGAGQVSPEPPARVLAGSPLVLFGEADPGSTLRIEWQSGDEKRHMELAALKACPEGETLRLLRGARLITDLEARTEEAPESGPVARRQASRKAALLADLSAAYGLASREMALVAVVERAGDRPGDLPVTRVVPVGMAQDVQFHAYFMASPAQDDLDVPAYLRKASTIMAQPAAPPRILLQRMAASPRSIGLPGAMPPPPEPPDRDDELLNLASSLSPDGGMPGSSGEERAARSLLALLAFAQEGSTPDAGTFRLHARKLRKFLESLAKPDPAIAQALEALDRGEAPAGNWLDMLRKTPKPGQVWKAVQKALVK
jgi:Ca-activated chloride channel homolog